MRFAYDTVDNESIVHITSFQLFCLVIKVPGDTQYAFKSYARQKKRLIKGQT
jgi:hypothetical protein